MALEQKLNPISVETLGSWLATIASVSVAVSAFVEWAYCQGLGIKITQIPFGISDVTIGAVRWAPWLTSIAIGHLVGRAIYTEEHLERVAKISNDKTQPLRKRVFFNYIIMFRVFSYPAVLSYLLLGEKFFPLFLFGLGFVATELLYISRNYIDIFKNFNRETMRLLSIIVTLSLIVYMQAYLGGKSDIYYAPLSKIEFEDNKSLQAKILRSYDAGFLVYTDHPIFIRRDHVQQISLPQTSPRVGIPCYLFNVLCIKP